jgi:SAM-dependent methyltransferase
MAEAGTTVESRPRRLVSDERWRLVGASFLMLFVELALIRWTGSRVIYLSYFSNFVLLGSFLGIGIGFLRARGPGDWFAWAPAALAALVTFVAAFPVQINRSGGEVIFFGGTPSGLPTWVTLPVVFLCVAAVLAMIAQGVARSFATFEALEAYRLDVLGSLSGIVAFAVVSFLRSPPVVWAVIVAVLFVILGPAPPRRTLPLVSRAALALLVGLLAIESIQPGESWSPYYRVTTTPVGEGAERVWLVDVNGIPHQQVQSVATRAAREPVYFLPYARTPDNPLRNVLVVGSGNGSDVAIALQAGAQHVDAVEIDPRLYEIGVALHPDLPYYDDRVDAYIDDGRAFLERTDTEYDLILFALPDSLTLVAGQSALRLESYLFTTGAMEEAREHLAPGGVFAMYNFYRENWLVDRLAGTLAQTYDAPPCLDLVEGSASLALLTVSDSQDALDCPRRWAPLTDSVPPPVTDDDPFPYLRQPGVPAFYLLTIGLILAASLIAVRVAAGPFSGMRPYADLFCMGVAFLLLETKNVVQFALLFGTTWFVNAVVFAGVLASVYLAILVARRVRLPRPAVLYVALLAAVALAFVVPSSALLGLPVVVRAVAAIALAFTPIFLANLVFAQRFAAVGSSTVAFGANLLGAMVGGLVEYAALAVGYRALLIVVAAVYGLAFLLGRRHLTAAPG